MNVAFETEIAMVTVAVFHAIESQKGLPTHQMPNTHTHTNTSDSLQCDNHMKPHINPSTPDNRTLKPSHRKALPQLETL